MVSSKTFIHCQNTYAETFHFLGIQPAKLMLIVQIITTSILLGNGQTRNNFQPKS